MTTLPKKLANLLDARARVVDANEQAVAKAAGETREARSGLHAAEGRYMAALQETSTTATASAWELGYRHAHLETLCNAIKKAATTVHEAEQKEARARAALVDAKQEHKKLEIWCDARIEEARAEERRKERLALDELAQRGARAK